MKKLIRNLLIVTSKRKTNVIFEKYMITLQVEKSQQVNDKFSLDYSMCKLQLNTQSFLKSGM